MSMRYWKTPERLLRQKDGDFPVQLRPTGVIPETRDLQDSTLDADAAADPFGMAHTPKVKPHKVREAVLPVKENLLRKERLTMGGSIASVASLRERGAGQGQHSQGQQVAEFDPERDMCEEDAADLSAMKARQLAKRNYKWMPNPFGPKPGALGPGPEAEAKYYERYFDGRRPTEDQKRGGADEEMRDARPERPLRQRISPKQFWYQDDYITPDPPSVAMMNSRELKYAMVNEAHVVRKWRNGQREGRAAGLPEGGAELWMAFGLRAAELAHVGSATAGDDFLGPGASGSTASAGPGGDADGDVAEARGRRPPQRCSLSSALRFLQAMASVQAGPYTAIQQLLTRVLETLDELRPHQCFFILQAMSRLRVRHPKSTHVLQRMSLTWRALPHKKLVQAANAVAKLDLGGHLWAKPLRLALSRTLPQFSGKHFVNLKAIAVMELLNEPDAMRAYLEQAEKLRADVTYSRHLQVVEIHAHLLYPELWAELPEDVRLFLQQVRTAAERSRGPAEQPLRSRRPSRGSDGEESAGETDEDDLSDEGAESDLEGGARRPSFDRSKFSSALHADISRVLAGELGVDFHNRMEAGPLTVDMCNLATMTVVEAAAPWQFYAHSSQVTALARRRQELLRAMGFKVVRVAYHRWEACADDAAKAALLRKSLPSELLRASALPPA